MVPGWSFDTSCVVTVWIDGEERECEQSDLGSTESKSVRQNGSLTTTQLTIDVNLLVDPKLLIIGSKIGEGAHGKFYEGRSVAKPYIRLDLPTTVVTIIMYIFGRWCSFLPSSFCVIFLLSDISQLYVRVLSCKILFVVHIRMVRGY